MDGKDEERYNGPYSTQAWASQQELLVVFSIKQSVVFDSQPNTTLWLRLNLSENYLVIYLLDWREGCSLILSLRSQLKSIKLSKAVHYTVSRLKCMHINLLIIIPWCYRCVGRSVGDRSLINKLKLNKQFLCLDSIIGKLESTENDCKWMLLQR